MATIFSQGFESDSSGFVAAGALSSLSRTSLPIDGAGLSSLNQSLWLGRLGDGVGKSLANPEIVRLSLAGLTPGIRYAVDFDLLIGGSWDGAAIGYGADAWYFSVNGSRLVDTLFSNGDQGIDYGAYSPQRYSDTNYLTPAGPDRSAFAGAEYYRKEGVRYAGYYGIYYFGHGAGNPVLTFTATDTSAILEWSRYNDVLNFNDSPDEYWALDNVKISSLASISAVNRADVASGSAQGVFYAGGVVDVEITFTEAVYVSTASGVPTLLLKTGSVDRTAIYSSGSGTNRLLFTYSVQPGDSAPRLDYVSSSALLLNGGTIRDALGKDAVLALPAPGLQGSLGFNAAITISPAMLLDGTPANDVLNGGIGDDTLNGFGGDDSLSGAAGNDLLNGGSGNDALIGGAGIDILIGGAGRDAYYLDDSNDQLIDSDGIDTIYSSVDFFLPSGFENLWLRGGAIGGSGNGLNNRIYGNSIANVLRGDEGSDDLRGAAGDDSLDGGNGNDTLRGQLGVDTLTGGSGADHFWFESPLHSTNNADLITDFSSAEGDRIDLSRVIFSGLAVGPLAPTALCNGSTFTSSEQRLLFDGYSLVYDADGSGAGLGVCFARLSGVTALNSTDLWVM